MDRGEKTVRDIRCAVLLALIAGCIPLIVSSPYVVGQLTLYFIWACLVAQWNLVFGIAGIMSLAQVAIFAVGGYAAAMLSLYLDINYWFAWVLGAFVAVVVSFFIGFATVRMRGEYVAILTLAISVMLYAIVVTDVHCYRYDGQICLNFTGGTRGLVKFGDFGWIDLLGYKSRYLGNYYLGLGILTLSFVTTVVLIHSPYGMAFRALRDNEALGRTRGLNFKKYQMVVFSLAGFFSGLAGGIYAASLKTIGPTVLGLDLLLALLAMMVVGGQGSIWGPILGSAVLMLLDEVLKSTGQMRSSILALLTVVFVIFLPRGLAGMLEDLGNRLVQKKDETGVKGIERPGVPMKGAR